jgi:hypothetical protein
MQTAQKEINKLLRRLPEDCSMEDIQYHIYVLQKVGCFRLRQWKNG